VEGSGRGLFQSTGPEIAVGAVKNHDKPQLEWFVPWSRIEPQTTYIEVRYITTWANIFDGLSIDWITGIWILNIECEDVDWIHLAQDRDQWLDILKDFPVKKAGSFDLLTDAWNLLHCKKRNVNYSQSEVFSNVRQQHIVILTITSTLDNYYKNCHIRDFIESTERLYKNIFFSSHDVSSEVSCQTSTTTLWFWIETCGQTDG
jgi:hypothetical protein